MAYEVTATRRRPQRFEDLVGQEFVAATLKNSIQAGKIAHAYLFSGPRGCGKTSSARILAKALNCEKGPTAAPCGVCTVCQEITKGSNLDVIEIDGASNTSVNDIRQIKDEVLFPPNSCRYKIYIIDEVHMLSTSAFNALLKTIEEPPPYVIFIFATTELHKVPATIKSRCQQFNFRLVAVEQLKELLAQAATEINVQADPEALYWIAREATGSVRDAYTLFDQVASFSESHITYDKIRSKLGLVGVDILNQLCETFISQNAALALDLLDKILENGTSIEQFISNLTDYFRSLLLIKTGITREALLGQSAERYSSVALEKLNIPQLERGLSLLLDLYRDIRYSLNPRYEVDLAISRLCGLTSFVSNKEVQKMLEDTRKLLLGSNANQEQIPQSNFSSTESTPKANIPPNLTAQFSKFPSSQEESYPLSNGGAVPPEHRQPSFEYENEKVSLPEEPVSDSFFVSIPKQPDDSILNQEESSDEKKIIPLENLKDYVIKELSISHIVIASALIASESWDFSKEGFVQITVPSAFCLSQLQKEKDFLNKLFSSLTGRNLVIEPILKQQKPKEEITIPIQAELLCKMFKGSIVGVKKNESL